MPALLEHLKTKKVNIKCTKENVFCFDSEGYRFLAAHKYGIKFDADLFDSYRKSWDYSVKETERLITCVRNLKPHKTKETLSLNTARHLILNLTKPMAEITRNIVLNVEILKKEESRIESLSEDTKNLRKDLMVDKINLNAKELGYPRTVCTNSECVKVTGVEGHHKINYITWCHDHCYLEGVSVETTNNTALLKCWAMNDTDTCRVCNHNYGEHMHITYELIESTVKVENESVKKLVDENASLKEIRETAIKGLRERIDELKQEHVAIEKAAAKFGAFLEHNAITAYSDARLEYLQFLINEEKKKKTEFKDDKLLAALEDSLRIYSEEVALIKKTIADGRGSELLDISQIDKSISQLYKLKHSGRMLKQIKNVAVKASSGSYREENHNFSNISIRSGLYSAANSFSNAVKGGVKGAKNWTKKNVQKHMFHTQKSQQKQQPARKYSTRKPTESQREQNRDRERVEQTASEEIVTQAEGEEVTKYIERCLKSFKPGLPEQERVGMIIIGLQPEYLEAAYEKDFARVFDLKTHLISSEINDLDK